MEFISLVLVSLIISCKSAYSLHYELNDPVVLTTFGLVEGAKSYSRNDRPFNYFKGIPYAEPPVGNLRFKNPIDPKPWKNIRQCKEHKSICMQQDSLFQKNPPIEGSEDCLYLNVYTPENFKTNINVFPVMVFIHYGGFYSGNGNDDIVGPEYFMDKDVVLVTFNYRLGVFGFISTGDNECPGNFGLKDQVLALKWVRNNILQFGGDPNKITIFGQSSGGASVHHHILSPASKGLFHAAISESGSAFNNWAYPQNGTNILKITTRKHAEFVGCKPNESTSKLINCLRNVDAKKLIEAMTKLALFLNKSGVIYVPVLEHKTCQNPNPFITQTPYDILKEKTFNTVPWISGVVTDEGALKAPLLRNPKFVEDLNANFRNIIPLSTGLPISSPETWLEIKNEIINFYFKNGGINVDNKEDVQNYTDIIGDTFFYNGIYQSMFAHSQNGHSPLWFYYFNYRGQQSYADKFALTSKTINFTWGAAHCDELLYLFPTPKLFNKLEGSDSAMIDVMIEMWTNFAIYHDPTPFTSNILDVNFKWEKVNKLKLDNNLNTINSDLNYMNITGSYNKDIFISMGNNFLPERMKFWEKFKRIENINSKV